MRLVSAATMRSIAVGVLALCCCGLRELAAAPQTPYLVVDIDPAVGAGSFPQVAPRFNNLDGQGTVVLLQNRSSETISGQLLFWPTAGWLGHIEPFTVPARGAIAINTLPLERPSGSLTITHDGAYGALVGKAVAIEPATGFSFDTPFTPRPR